MPPYSLCLSSALNVQYFEYCAFEEIMTYIVLKIKMFKASYCNIYIKLRKGW
jgi:hypothetical protein